MVRRPRSTSGTLIRPATSTACGSTAARRHPWEGPARTASCTATPRGGVIGRPTGLAGISPFRQSLTTPPLPGARCLRRVLVMSADPRKREALEKSTSEMPEMPSLAIDSQTRLPQILDDYRAIWIVDEASVQSGAGQTLASYVR